jgi:predicted AlkP superfamily phosphohydrolase/phosphomutase
MRVLIFGVDGLAFRVLHPMMQAGYLPNFQALARDGVESVLESKYPPLTPPAWMSLSTGLKPAKHGTYDFWEYDEQGNDRLVSKRKDGKAIWNILSDYGKKVIVVNVPHTYGPDPVNGIMVSGIPGSEQADFVYPKSFRDELFAHVPGYRVDGNYSAVRQGKLTHAQAAVQLMEQRIALMHYLLDTQEWDFSFITFCAADYLQHLVWEDIMRMEPEVMRYYQLLDEALGYAREAIGADGALFVVSDHGFQGAKTKFAINEYLYRHGWLQTSRPLNRRKELVRMTGKQVLDRFNLLEVGRGLKYRFFSSPDQPKKTKQTPYFSRQEQLDAGVSMTSYSAMSGGFADLCISKPMTEQQMADLRGELLSLTDPSTGQRVVDAMYSTEVYGQGPYQPQEEHLLLLPGEGYTFTPVLGRPWLWEREQKFFGTHQKDGVLYAYGQNIKAGLKGTPAEIYDVVPTILRTMNLPVPTGLDGRVIEDLFVEQGQPESDEGESKVARKLKLLLKQ